MPSAILECTEGAWTVSTPLPNGKKREFHFTDQKKDGHFICEVPTELTYVDDFKKTRVFHENFAQHLVNSYPFVRVVKVLEEAAVKSVAVKDRPAVVDAKTHAEEIAAGVKAELARLKAEEEAEKIRLANEAKTQRELMQTNLRKAREAKALVEKGKDK